MTGRREQALEPDGSEFAFRSTTLRRGVSLRTPLSSVSRSIKNRDRCQPHRLVVLRVKDNLCKALSTVPGREGAFNKCCSGF